MGGRCPVCRARFRESRLCSRCGADLGRVMFLAVSAWRLREAARQALERGDYAKGLDWAREAQKVHSTGRGKRLALLCEAGYALVRDQGGLV
jgi:predicted amidophosphoribosyltransferase